MTDDETRVYRATIKLYEDLGARRRERYSAMSKHVAALSAYLRQAGAPPEAFACLTFLEIALQDLETCEVGVGDTNV